jgi:hypothetical protein
MRNKIVWVVAMVVGVVLLWGIQGFSGQGKDGNSCFGEDKYLLKAPEGVEARRGPVNFPHQAHFEFACVKCHHTFDGSEPPMGCTVSGCHDTTEAPAVKSAKSSASDNMDYYKNAYHQTCWLGCHKEIKARNAELQKAAAAKGAKAKLAKSGPTTCDGCHGKAGRAK